MKKFLTPLLMLLMSVAAFAQPSLPTGSVPAVDGKLGMSQGQGFCPNIEGKPITSHNFVYSTHFAPSVLLITVTTSTGGAFTANTTASTVTGGTITVTGSFTGICFTVTTLTGTNASVDGSYYGPALGSAGTATVSGEVTVVQPTGTNLHVVVDSGGGGGSTAQGAAISGVTGGLGMGSVTTSAPIYTTATANSLSLNTAGGLRVAPTTPDAIEGAAVATTPVPVGCVNRAIGSVVTLADGGVGYLTCSANNELVVSPFSTRANDLAGLITTAMTGTTSTAVTGMGAQGAGIKNYVTGCVVSNSHATVGTDVILQDGSGGSTLFTLPAGAVYGGTAFYFPNPVHTTANTALYAADVTTGASVKLSCTGFKGK